MCEVDTNCLTNVEGLIAAMGEKPCFHDAHVLRSKRTETGCEVTIHMFLATREIDARGFYKLEKHHLVTLVMSDIREIFLSDPYERDILGELSVRRDGELVRIEFDSVMSSGGYVLCGKAGVAKVVPCDSEGHEGY